MDRLRSFFTPQNRNLLVLLVLLTGIGVTTYVVRQQQNLRGRAQVANTTLQFVDAAGQPISTTMQRDVTLRLTFPGAVTPSPTVTIAPSPTTLPTASPTVAPSPTITPTPTVVQADADNDGDSNATDCGPNDARARHGQTLYFATTYTNASGQSSFDYNCDGNEELNPEKNCVGTHPAPACYTSQPSGRHGYVSGVPGCGQTAQYRSCQRVNSCPDSAADQINNLCISSPICMNISTGGTGTGWLVWDVPVIMECR